MENEKNNNQSVRPSLFKTLEEVKTQISYEYFHDGKTGQDTQVTEICLIIAEILILNPEHEIKIAGTVLPVGIVREVFKQLDFTHIELTVENINTTTGKIHNKKSYIRTALYNSVFEIDTHYKNQIKHDYQHQGV